ncbi:MAG: hypothetical protein ACLFPX_07440 [Candidatus Omnitrophota bacterium]
MSKNAKLIIALTGIVLLVVLGLLFFVIMQKQQAETTASSLQEQIEDYSQREKTYILENKKIKDQIAEIEQAKAELEEELAAFEGVDINALQVKVKTLTEQKEEWQQKVESLKQQREDLVAKLEEKPEEKIVYKYVESREQIPEGASFEKEESPEGSAVSKREAVKPLNENEDFYWAQVLKEKTALQLQVEKLENELNQKTVKVTELKKANSDLQLELSDMINRKEEIVRKIKHGHDLSDSLSLELARAQNDKKFLNDRLVKINQENDGLREQIKKLTSTKIALEKTIVRIQDEKQDVEKKLHETENVIQSRIDEIWDIKKSLDQTLSSNAPVDGQVELPPIVVSDADSPEDMERQADAGAVRNGNVVSINPDNNFVIVDLGQEEGVELGDSLNVYRGAEYVAGLEVIQVREGIAAADIVSKDAKIQIGDAVR